MKHDLSLYKYYDENVHHIFDDSGTLSCCKTPYDIVHTPDTNCQNIPEEELSDFSEGEIDEIDFLLSSDDICNVNENESVQNVPDKLIDLADIPALFSEEKMSPLDKTVCGHYKDLLKTQRIDLEYFVNKLYSLINEIFIKTCGVQKSTDPKTWTQYHAELYKFSISKDYVSLVKVISKCEPTNQDFELCSKMFDKVASAVLKKHSDHIDSKHDTSFVNPVNMSEAGKRKLRYIFARCVAKSRFHNMKNAKVHMYKQKNRVLVSKAFLKVKMLDSLTESYSELICHSKYQETLVETQRKQNLAHGLTNISDQTFEFISKIGKKKDSCSE